MKKKIWTHKKYKGEFVGSYVRTKNDRVFQLSSGKKVFSYESWQAAVRDGFKR
jgi:hypothetical protein